MRITQFQIDAARQRGLATVDVPGEYKRNKGSGYTGPGGVQVGSRRVSNAAKGINYEVRAKEQKQASAVVGTKVEHLGYRNEWRTYRIKSSDPASVDRFLQSLPDRKRIWIVVKGLGHSGQSGDLEYMTVLDNSENFVLRPGQSGPSARMQEFISNTEAMQQVDSFYIYVKD